MNGRNIYVNIPMFQNEKQALLFLYEITRDGRVFRKIDGKELKTCNGPKGYKYIRLVNPQFSKNQDRRKSYKVHRLVAMMYLDDYSDKLQVNHKNGDKKDNRYENLEMVTNRENALHAWRELDKDGKRHKRVSCWSIAINKRTKVNKIKDGVIVGTYESMMEGARSVNGFCNHVSRCCRFGGKYKGYEWRFA